MKSLIFAAVVASTLDGAAAESAPAGNLYCPSLVYKGRSYSSYDSWCQATCTQFLNRGPTFLTFCPSSMCKCSEALEPANMHHCTSPRKCSSGKYKAVPGSTASDAWCDVNCKHNPANCPCTECKCAQDCRDYEKGLKVTFEEVTTGYTTRVNNIVGVNFSGNAHVMNTDKFRTTSGYPQSVKTPHNIMYNGFGRNIEVSVPGHTFRIIRANGSAAWKDGLKIKAEALDAQGQVIGTFEQELSTTEGEKLAFKLPTADKIRLSATGGTKNPNFRGDGHHFSLDDVKLCVPKEFRNREPVPEEEDVERRSDEGDDDTGAEVLDKRADDQEDDTGVEE